MRVLLTNNRLAERAGSELYLYDVALELLRRGHQPVAFSTVHGEVAAQLRAATIPVIDSLQHCGEPPDIIHGHHHYDTTAASLFFPNTPVISFCHGWIPMEEEPVLSPRVVHYVAVDDVCRDRLISTFGIAAQAVTVLLNFVDTERFRRRPPLPAKPRRALAFSNYFSQGEQLAAIQHACDEAGLELDVVGLASGRPVADPEKILPAYDVVFAKARAAMEAMAVGAAVILAGPRGFGPMVTPDNWSALRRINFGVRALGLPVCVETISEQLSQYDPASAAAVCELIHEQARLTDTVDQLLELYSRAIDEFREMPQLPGAAEQATARYLTRYAPLYKAFGGEYQRRSQARERRSLDVIWTLLRDLSVPLVAPGEEVTGRLDVMEVRSPHEARVAGWVAHLPSGAACRAVLLIQDDRCTGLGFCDVPRPDVNQHLQVPAVSFGFDIQFEVLYTGPIRVLAVLPSGALGDISSLAGPEIEAMLQGIEPHLAKPK